MRTLLILSVPFVIVSFLLASEGVREGSSAEGRRGVGESQCLLAAARSPATCVPAARNVCLLCTHVADAPSSPVVAPSTLSVRVQVG